MTDGIEVGVNEGDEVGTDEGKFEGNDVDGTAVGEDVGIIDGEDVDGIAVGIDVGTLVGALEHSAKRSQHVHKTRCDPRRIESITTKTSHAAQSTETRIPNKPAII